MPLNLREHRVEETATLPGGDEVIVRVGVPNEPYIGRQSDTVAVELVAGDDVVAVVNTVLAVDQAEEARTLAGEIVAGLESGDLEPTAAAIEPLADQPR